MIRERFGKGLRVVTPWEESYEAEGLWTTPNAHSTTTHTPSTSGPEKRLRDPLDYHHPYDSMRRYAELLALRHDSTRTRHSYYCAMRLVHEHFGADPATLGEDLR